MVNITQNKPPRQKIPDLQYFEIMRYYNLNLNRPPKCKIIMELAKKYNVAFGTIYRIICAYNSGKPLNHFGRTWERLLKEYPNETI